MSRRLSMIPPALLALCCAVLPACKKKPPEEVGGGGGDPVVNVSPPAAASSEHLLFLRFQAKDVRDSSLFTEVKQAFAKADGTALWDQKEGEIAAELGVKPTDVDTVTVCVTEVPKLVVIVTTNKPVNKGAGFGLKPGATPDSRGLYKTGGPALVHYPDDKTVVLVSEALAQQYLDGYAKNRSGWPLTAELSKAAAGHTLFLSANPQKMSAEARKEPEAKEYAALLAARAVTVTADLKGKELSLGVRGTYADPAAAAKAKEQAQSLIKQAAGAIDEVARGKELAEFSALMPVVKEAQRAVGAAKVEVSGSDVTLAASYRADFDVGQIAAELVKKVKEVAPRITAQNNLKQIGLGLHSYHDANGRLVVHGIGANAMPLKNATDKPLLSWRVAILPYVEQGDLYKKFKLDEPWDGPNNKKLLAEMPKIFAPVGKPGKPGFTHLQMAVGPGAMPLVAGHLVQTIPDGTSNTIAVFEAADAVEWTKPADFTVPAKAAPGELKKKFGGQFPGGFNVLLWDGSVRFVKDTVSESTLRLLLDPRDGMPLPGDW